MNLSRNHSCRSTVYYRLWWSKAIYEIIAGDYSAYPVAEEFGGIMDVTYPPAMIQDTIQALVDHFEGKPVPQENTQSAQCVTADNVADFMDQGFE